MQASNGSQSGVSVTEIVGGLKVITSEVQVKVPVFVDYEVKQPVFVAEQVQVPTGWDRVTNAIALEITDKVWANLEKRLQTSLDAAIKDRIDTIKVPKIVEEVKLIIKEVVVEKPIFTEVQVEKPVFKDKTIINPVLKDVEVVNALIIDKPVVNAIVEDVKINNAIIKDVDVERAVIREKIVDVIHPRYLDLKGNPVT